jgi:uncharacterized protein
MSAVKLQGFQSGFAKHLRSPSRVKRPAGVPLRPAKIYQELLFNNICGFVDSCFPVAKSLFPEVRWRRLCRSFFQDWPSHTPYFSRIPEQFVRFMQAKHTALRVPAYLPELLHYEWLELEVDTAADQPAGSLSSRRLSLNSCVRYARFQWPVHRIGTAYRPRKPSPTVLVVHRNAEHAVKFIEINEITAQLLDIFADGPQTAQDALKLLAKRMGQANPDSLQIHGRQLLAGFIQQDIISGKLK